MNAPTGTTTYLIADDQAMVREGFGALLAAQSDLDVVAYETGLVTPGE